jgi:predicted nucleotidyltransferase
MAATALNYKSTFPRSKKTVQAIDFIEDFMRWSKKREDFRALALAGSYAREEASEDSDLDLIIITDDPRKYLLASVWTTVFGKVIAKKVEDHGKLTSLRVWYESGLEIEFGFTTREWVHIPLDAVTKKVIDDGLRVLFEKEPLFSLIM